MLDDNKVEQEGQETPEEQSEQETAEATTTPVDNTEDTVLDDEVEDTDESEDIEEEEEIATTVEEEEVEEEEDEDEDEDLLDEPVMVGTAHDDFDWNAGKRAALAYSKEDLEKYTEQYESTLSSVLENEIVKGRVTSINDGDVVLDINFKSDGLVPLS
nr:30S ribosomal protein S1 [Saprospiraceae bacterium]